MLTAFQDSVTRPSPPSGTPAPFIVEQISDGTTLFVGEGNMSFARSVLELTPVSASNFVVTVYEEAKDLNEDARINAAYLTTWGAKIVYNINAKNLADEISGHKFDTVIFQFPNTGSREAIRGENPNAVLIRRFLGKTQEILNPDGKVIITHVDSSYYLGQFQIEEAAKATNYDVCFTKDFDPDDYPGYNHKNTQDDASALEKYDRFITWVLYPS